MIFPQDIEIIYIILDLMLGKYLSTILNAFKAENGKDLLFITAYNIF